MSIATETPANPEAPSTDRTATWKWMAAGAALAVAVTVGVVAFVLTLDNDNSSQALDSQRIATTQNACQQWLDDASNSTDTAPYPGWCNDMTSWMNDQITNGGMMGSMMWGNPQAMIDTCQNWAATAPNRETTATAGATITTGWCDQMVGWMAQHMNNWDDAADWDDHMGDGHWGNGMMGP